MEYPTGTVTFLFTDIEGSTKLAQEHPGIWESLRERHHTILRSAIESHNGYIFQIIGDAFCVAFHKAGDAIKAALKSQQELQNESWNEALIRVRMGIHTGEAEIDGRDYRGYLTLSLVQRVMSAGHGGQILLSNATENLLRDQLPKDVTLRGMGEHKFKDISHPVRVFQVVAPDLQSEFPALRTLNIFPNNLPTQITSFVGREKELADVKKLLHDAHMLTLIGPGGTGKTRLSIQSASESLTQYPDGVWLVELAPILDPLLVPRTTAIAIGLRDEPQRPIIDMLCDYLRDKKMLILLDNCEHLVDACAQMADRLLHASSHARILASSREALGIAGEVTYRVPSLGLPDMGHLPSFESLSQYEAVRLFIDRATSAVSTFTVTNDNAPSLAQICHRLDGIPLAIELAAAKIRVLSVEQIAKRLDDRFRLLTGGSRTALERHQTLRAAIDWSYNLLPPSEQVLFRRLAIFVGGWALEAAESVCGDESASSIVRSGDVLNLLEQLIHKSLVIAEEAGGESRYRMLETMRQYANEKLVESGESDALRDRHLDYFLTLVETAESHLRCAEQIEWLQRLDAEIENLRATLAWSMDKSPAEPALRLVGALGSFWDLRAYWKEGAKWMDQALSRKWDENSKTEKPARAKVLYHRAGFASTMDEMDVMKTSAESALALCEDVKDAWGSAYARAMAAEHLSRIGDFKASKALFEQSLNEFQRLGDAWGESVVLSGLPWVEVSLGDMEKYSEHQRDALVQARISGDRDRIARALGNIALSLRIHGEWDQVEKLLLERNQLYLEIGSSEGVDGTRFSRAMILLARGELEEAKAETKLFIDYCQRIGDRNMQAMGRLLLGQIAEIENDFEGAVVNLQEGLSMAKEIGMPDTTAIILIFLGRIKVQQGYWELAIPYLRESLGGVKSGKVGTDGPAIVFCQIGGMLLENKPRIAVQFLGYSEVFWQTINFPRDPTFDKPYFERFISSARAKLSDAEFTSAWEAGLKMTVEEAIEFALQTVEEM